MLQKIIFTIYLLLLTGGVMASEFEYLKKLEKFKNLISDFNDAEICNSYFSNIKKKISYEIPEVACMILSKSNVINEEYGGIFLGFNALSLDQIATMYSNVSSPDSFFFNYKVDSKYNVGEDRSIVIEEYKQKGHMDAEIKNVSTLLPLFSFQGDYIVVNLDSKRFGELMIISHGHLANILAPSLSLHVSDLVDGLKSDIYKERDGELIYPPVWEDRKDLKSGKVVMDEYGDVSKSY